MEAWVSQPNQIPIVRLHILICLLAFVLTHITPVTFTREKIAHIIGIHCRKNKDDVEVDADQIQLDLLGDPILSKEFIMKAIL